VSDAAEDRARGRPIIRSGSWHRVCCLSEHYARSPVWRAGRHPTSKNGRGILPSRLAHVPPPSFIQFRDGRLGWGGVDGAPEYVFSPQLSKKGGSPGGNRARPPSPMQAPVDRLLSPNSLVLGLFIIGPPVVK